MYHVLMFQVPFSSPYVPELAIEFIKESLKSPEQQGDGIFSQQCENMISRMYEDAKCLLVPSCTAALELSSMLIDLEYDEEVIMPSFTFTSAATAITKFKGIPIFCDIDPENGCIDSEKIEDLITEKTKAISYVNYAGNGPNVDKIIEIARKYKLRIIEDAAHNFGVLTHSQESLTGDFVTFSFHATKNIQCGEGGAIIIRDESLLEKAQIIREKGTNRIDFKRGKVNKYRWVGSGSSYLLAEVNSAILKASLIEFKGIQVKRTSLVRNYESKLGFIGEFGWTTFNGTLNSAHMFALLAPDETSRKFLSQRLSDFGITAVSHYEDLSTSPEGLRIGRASKSGCPESIKFSKRILRLPLFTSMTISQVEYVVDSIRAILSKEKIS